MKRNISHLVPYPKETQQCNKPTCIVELIRAWEHTPPQSCNKRVMSQPWRETSHTWLPTQRRHNNATNPHALWNSSKLGSKHYQPHQLTHSQYADARAREDTHAHYPLFSHHQKVNHIDIAHQSWIHAIPLTWGPTTRKIIWPISCCATTCSTFLCQQIRAFLCLPWLCGWRIWISTCSGAHIHIVCATTWTWLPLPWLSAKEWLSTCCGTHMHLASLVPCFLESD